MSCVAFCLNDMRAGTMVFGMAAFMLSAMVPPLASRLKQHSHPVLAVLVFIPLVLCVAGVLADLFLFRIYLWRQERKQRKANCRRFTEAF